jgi:hypothetical protein
VGLVAFGLYEAFIVKEGILDHRLFETANFPILMFVCAIDGMLLLGVNVAFSQEAFYLFTQDAVSIAVMISPYLILSTFGCIPAGWVMAYTRSYRAFLVAALAWCALFTGEPRAQYFSLLQSLLILHWLGLMGLVTADRKGLAYAFSALFGAGTAVTTTIPGMHHSFSSLRYLFDIY